MFYDNGIERKHFYNIQCLMMQVKKPKLMYVFSKGEIGIGICSNALPSAKYWSCQFGATKEMKDEHRKELLSGNSDFIYINDLRDAVKNGISIELLEKNGYKTCYHYDYTYLMTNRIIKKSDADIAVSNQEVLLKRTPSL